MFLELHSGNPMFQLHAKLSYKYHKYHINAVQQQLSK